MTKSKIPEGGGYYPRVVDADVRTVCNKFGVFLRLLHKSKSSQT